MRILVVGVGYVGLVTGTCFAEMGHHVICLDIDEKKIDSLNKGKIPIYERGLQELVTRNMEEGRLSFTSNYAESVPQSEVCFLAVATPQRKDRHADLRYILSASESLAEHMDAYKVIVNKSTVPVGTATEVRRVIAKKLKERNVEVPFDVVANPEFLKEGDAINDCMKPDRIIIGTDSKHAEDILRNIYSAFTVSHERMIFMDIASAELTKYASNAMLATRISFMNELSIVCERAGANIDNIRKGIGSDKRIGYSFLYAGAGFGGSCFPKDLHALCAQGEALQTPLPLINEVLEANERQKTVLAKKIESYFATRGGVADKTIAILGLAFKPNTDDMREASSIVLTQTLREKGVSLRLFDPVASEHAKTHIPPTDRVIYCKDEMDCVKGADAVVLVTEWKQFRFLDFDEVLKQMKGKAFFDGRNQYRRSDMQERGFDYLSIGRPPVYADKAESLDSYPTAALIDPDVLKKVNF